MSALCVARDAARHTVCVPYVHTLHLAVSHECGAALITYR
jgi:hypothetical protein